MNEATKKRGTYAYKNREHEAQGRAGEEKQPDVAHGVCDLRDDQGLSLFGQVLVGLAARAGDQVCDLGGGGVG